MTDFTPESLASIGPKEFAQLVKSTPDAKIAEVMQSDARDTILDGVFFRMPQLFRADRAGDTQTVIQWNITDKPGGGTDVYETVIENGACNVNKGSTRDPKLALSLASLDFLKVVSGDGNPMMLFMTGKVKAKGDLALAANIAKLFDIPRA
jgi:putative sterol carrier protein